MTKDIEPWRNPNPFHNDIAPALIYKIDQLEAMCLTDAAWCEVDTIMI
jgi:hypothetical protein